MGGMTGDGQTYQYGTGDNHGTIAYGVGANQQLYSGEVALVSGSGSTTAGLLKNGATYGSQDRVVGMLGEIAGGTGVKTSNFYPLPTVDGTASAGLWIDVQTGTHMFQSGSGADQLSASTNGTTVYYGGENSIGPIACATSSGGTRPVLGTQIPQDPGIAGGFTPGSNYWPITVAVLGSP